MAAGISVALCTWNGAAHLEEQLDSILAQRRLPDQLIACDDDSGDDSAAILSRFAARAPAHWSGPRGVPARPASSPRQATITRRGADATTRDAGGREKDPTWTARGLVA